MSGLLATLNSEKSQLSYDLETGIAYGSKRLAARLAGVSVGSVIEMLKGDQLQPSKGAEFLSGRGFKGDQLLGDKASLPADLIQSIITYFAMYAGRWCNNAAKANLDFLSQVGLTVAMKSALDIPVDDRPQQSAPQVVVEQPDVTINIGQTSRSHHDHLTPLQSHLDEVVRLRERVKKMYNTASEQTTKELVLARIDASTAAFCRELAGSIEVGQSVEPSAEQSEADPNARAWAAMDAAVMDPMLTDNVRKRTAKYAAIVRFRWENPRASLPAIAKHFGISVSNVSTACDKFRFAKLVPKSGADISSQTIARIDW